MSKIYITRHGETDFNKQGRYAGRINVSLNTSGRQQAEELKKKIKNLKIDVIIASPLKRAIETAEIIKPNNCEIISNHAFIERSVGVYEGLTKEEAKEKYPKLYAKNITRILNEAPTGGETIAKVQNRVFAGLDKILAPPQSPERDCGEQIKLRRKSVSRETAAERNLNKNILIVTHAFIAKVINKYFNQQISEQNFFDFVLQNAEIKEYYFKNILKC